MSAERGKTNEDRIKDEMRAGARELGVDLEVGRIPDELLPQGRTRITLYGEAEAVRMTKEERAIQRLREIVAEYGGNVRVGRIPDEDLPQGPIRMTFFGEAERRVPGIGERVEVRVEDGTWRAGYRALSEPVDARTIPAEQLKAAGASAEDSVVWITDEERWLAAPADERASLPGMPWPVEQIRIAEPPE